MTARIAVRSYVEDARARSILHTLKNLFPRVPLKRVATASAYTIDAKLTAKELERSAERLTNPVIEKFSTRDVPTSEKFVYALEIGYLPGITDNVGRTAQETIEDCLGRKFRDSEAVYSSLFIFLEGALERRDIENFARELHNPLIERATIFSKNPRGDTSWNSRGVASGKFPIIVPKVELQEHAKADEVNLEVPDEELVRIGKEGIANADGSRRGPLALSLRALHIICDYFRSKGRNPIDVELESLAQTWSEHCKHTIFADPLDEIEEGIYRRYIKGATQHIRARKGKKDFCVSVFTDNSGAIVFDDKYLVTHKVETHNSPSALDPFGGAITGIVGVNRDCLGFGLGAKPIANVYGFCVGPPSGGKDTIEYFRDQEKTHPVLPARRILEGVVRGVNAGGNQSGIPTPLGFVATDPRFNAKPLVFAGTVGLILRKSPSGSRGRPRKLYEKCAKPGDYVVMIGGRVGLDGIHGATFSSEALTKGSPATAVQIGDPITQKKFSDALIREARDAGLYNSITDDGAGGLSGSVGEMSREAGGCVVDLEKVPLKYPGLAPWQIWLSESQERMTLAVPKSKWKTLKKIFDRHGVEATRIGVFTDSPKCIVRYRGKEVMNVGMEFLHDGRPIEIQRSSKVSRTNPESPPEARKGDLGKILLEMLSRPSIGSISFISQQYDHEVQGTSVTKPLHGRGRVNADAGVLQPLPDSKRGIVLSHGYCPWYSDIDTYAMAASAIDTAVRNAVCAGASLDYLAILDNFCWSSSDKPERLYELKRAAQACYDVATAYGTPFISGKDSMFNDFRGFTADGKAVHIAALPTLLISAIGVMQDIRKAVTLDLKQPGDLVYLIGETHDELGASEYFTMVSDQKYGLTKSVIGNRVPKVDAAQNMKAYSALSKAIQKDLVASAIGVGRGGLAVALAKSSVAGQLGIEANLSRLPGNAKEAGVILFSESQGRIVVSVRPSAKKAFKKIVKSIPHALIGKVSERPALLLKLRNSRLVIPVAQLAAAYQKPFKNW